ncbi:MAG: tetratricopeptide repeat protein, partial [Acidobacteriota bacterium]
MLDDASLEIKKQIGLTSAESPKRASILLAKGSSEAMMLYNEGVNHLNLGNDLSALQFLEKAEQKKPENALLQATLSVVNRNLGREDRSQQHARLAKELLSDNLSVLDSHFVQATYATSIYDYETAIRLYKQLLGIYPDSSELYYRLGLVHEEASSYQDALECLKHAIDLDLKFAPAYLRMAILYLYQDKHDSALGYAKEALRLYSEIANSEGRARAFSTIGKIYQGQTDYPEAKQAFEQALQIDRALQNNSGIAHDLRNVAISYMEQGNLQEASEPLQQAHDLYRSLCDRLSLAYMDIEVGNAKMRFGEYEAALEPYFKALKASGELKNSRLLADSHDRLGQAYNYLENYPQ